MTRRGFSLVEIVVVLAILGVAAAAAAPALRDSTRGRGAAAAAGEVARLLRAARRTALEDAVPVVVTVVPTTGRYVVEVDRDDTTATLAEGTLAVATGVRLTSGGRPMRVAFDRYGVAQPDSFVVHDDDGIAVAGIARWSGEVYVRVGER